MREWKLYLKCLRHNAKAASMATICILGFVALLPAHLTGDTTLVWIVAGIGLAGFAGFVLSGAGADTYAEYLITRCTILKNAVRPKFIAISCDLPRSEQIGAELACEQFGVECRTVY